MYPMLMDQLTHQNGWLWHDCRSKPWDGWPGHLDRLWWSESRVHFSQVHWLKPNIVVDDSRDVSHSSMLDRRPPIYFSAIFQRALQNQQPVGSQHHHEMFPFRFDDPTVLTCTFFSQFPPRLVSQIVPKWLKKFTGGGPDRRSVHRSILCDVIQPLGQYMNSIQLNHFEIFVSNLKKTVGGYPVRRC